MITKIISSNSRGGASHDWLQTQHSFSFANYYDPDRVHFGALRVLNDDIIAPGEGFDMHPHHNMEIITYPLSGTLQHTDSMGNSGVLKHGEVQVMTAGKGIYHSEFNFSESEPLSLLQIWIFTNRDGHTPLYGQKDFSESFTKNELTLIVSPDGESDSLKINQEAWIWRGKMTSMQNLSCHVKGKNHGIYLFVVEGSVSINNQSLSSRDAMEITETSVFDIHATEDTEFLLIEVPMSDWSKT